jgi:RiboL-PSP-HEPN
MSRARQDFAISFADARRLFTFYNAELERSKPRIPEEAEVLKRAALMMAVTAFESYIEDYLREFFVPRLKASETPEKFQTAFELVAKKWLREHQDRPAAFTEWTGDGWKSLLTNFFEQRLNAFHTPKSDVVIVLFRQFLGVELSKYWAWQGYGHAAACKRLDEIAFLRGRIAHVARKAGSQPAKHEVSRSDLKKYLDFFEGIVAATEKVQMV